MPELPEVEIVKKGLNKYIVKKTIANFDCNWTKMINKPLVKYKNIIKGLQVEKVRRTAKMLIIDLSKGWNILIHLKMTGQLVYDSKTKRLVGGHPTKQGFACLPNKFTHATFTFTDKTHLYFNDIRKFGWLRLFTDQELANELAKLNLGPEPLAKNFTLNFFKDSLQKRPKSKIKQFLMDPKNLVGVGNIYSDEVCFYAKVKPTRLNKTLKNKEIELIYKGIKKILKDSIEFQGTTFSNFVNTDGETGSYSEKLKVYGRYGQKCFKCKGLVRKIKIGGRTSSFCPQCQK